MGDFSNDSIKQGNQNLCEKRTNPEPFRAQWTIYTFEYILQHFSFLGNKPDNPLLASKMQRVDIAQRVKLCTQSAPRHLQFPEADTIAEQLCNLFTGIVSYNDFVKRFVLI